MRRSAETPLVSVVLPVFNAGPFLREALDSILGQTYEQIEVIVLDDASTDATPEILRSYGSSIRVVSREQTAGQFASANLALGLSRGDLIAWYHADDVYFPDIVRKQVEYLRANCDVAAVFASDVFIDEHGREYGRLVLPPEIRGERPLSFATVVNTLLSCKNRFLRSPGAMVRRDVQLRVGEYRPERYGVNADLDMWLRIAREQPIAVLEEHLFAYRHARGSVAHRDHRLRVSPDGFFAIMDDCLASGAATITKPAALQAYDAHRAEDTLMRAVSCYITGDAAGARRTLAQLDMRAVIRSPAVQRLRLLALAGIMRTVTRLPRSGMLARLFYRRWHVRRGASSP